MKFLLALLILFSFKSHADSSAECTLVKGVYENSKSLIHDIRFETLVDVFSFSNAKALRLTLEGEELKFLREDIQVSRQTKTIFMMKKSGRPHRVIHMMIDRSPLKISKDREFYGNMIVSQKLVDGDWTQLDNSKSLRYNFYCSF